MTTAAVKKPKVKLVGEDGNAFAIMGRVRRALTSAGQPEKAAEFLAKATQGSYDDLLVLVQEYCDVR